MAVRYQHTQRGTLMIALLLLGAVVCGFAAWFNTSPGRWLPLALTVLLVVLTWLFSSLTVTVDGDEVQWYFGPAAWKYKLPRGDVADVSVVRNNPMSGFGIRMRPGFRLYNVSGLDAVELRLKSGEVRRIGTDDAPGLAAALKS